MEEALTNITIFLIMKVKTVIYQAGMDVFPNLLFISPKWVLAENISNSYNHIQKEVMF